jgi:hypothetical protein
VLAAGKYLRINKARIQGSIDEGDVLANEGKYQGNNAK